MPPEHFQVTDSALLDPNTRQKKIWVNFKPDIDLGHIIATFSFIGGLFIYAQGAERRITVLEQRLEATTAQAAETKTDIKEIKAVVNKIGTDLAVQNAITQRKQ